MGYWLLYGPLYSVGLGDIWGCTGEQVKPGVALGSGLECERGVGPARSALECLWRFFWYFSGTDWKRVLNEHRSHMLPGEGNSFHRVS